MQIKGLLSEREKLNEELKRKQESLESDIDKTKGLEIRLSQAIN